MCDQVLLPEIYFVRDSEQMKQQVSAWQLAEKIRQNGGSAQYLENFENILTYLTGKLTRGDMVVTMGAGDIWKVADELICRLRGHGQA